MLFEERVCQLKLDCLFGAVASVSKPLPLATNWYRKVLLFASSKTHSQNVVLCANEGDVVSAVFNDFASVGLTKGSSGLAADWLDDELQAFSDNRTTIDDTAEIRFIRHLLFEFTITREFP